MFGIINIEGYQYEFCVTKASPFALLPPFIQIYGN